MLLHQLDACDGTLSEYQASFVHDVHWHLNVAAHLDCQSHLAAAPMVPNV